MAPKQSSNVENIDLVLAGIRTDVAELRRITDAKNDHLHEVSRGVAVLEERIKHLPTKGFIVSVTAGALGLFSAIVVMQGQIVKLLA